MKFGILKHVVELGWAVLLSDVDIAVLQVSTCTHTHTHTHTGAHG